MNIARALLTFAMAGSLHAAEPSFATVDAALTQAKKAHTPLLLDFTAPWCYSCYFMATHVLNGTEWNALEAKAVIATVDADSPDGAAWMQKLAIKALPAYVVLNEDGVELGRILAEQPREKFYPMIDRIIAGASTLDGFKSKAAAGSLDAVAAVLGAYQARDDGNGGLDWYQSLPRSVRDHAEKDARITLWRDRLDLARATQAKDDAGIVSAAQRVLAGDIGCDRPYVIDPMLAASEKQAHSARIALLKPQRAALEHMLVHDVFVTKPACADERSIVIAIADVDAALGDAKGEKAVLDLAIESVQQQLQQLGNRLERDRNAADNLRVYLMRAKRIEELDALYSQLIAAYPDDYVYPYRYGKSLLERGNAAAALPLLEKAADKAYGVNRLAVAMQRVKALKALKRQSDADKVVADVLEQNGQWFPEQVAQLRAALKS
ncbi:MAG: thioredoxin family protein [Dokdonella sp.]